MVDVSTIGYFMPIISFLFVFVLIYALLIKTGILGENNAVALMISLFLSSFFIFNASLVEFVRVSSSWVVVFVVCLFFILTLLSFTHGKGLDKLIGNKVALAVLAVLILIFVISSSYVFNWVINFGFFKSLGESKWTGLVVLLIAAGVVGKVITSSK